MKAPRGFTLVEMGLCLTLIAIVLGFACELLMKCVAGADSSGEAAAAVRSMSIAVEHLRVDLEQLVERVPGEDLVISEDGRRLSIRTAHDRRVAYRVDGQRLVRDETPLPGCFLSDLHVRRMGPGGPSRLGRYLQITLVGMGSPKSAVKHPASLVLLINDGMEDEIP